MRDLAALAEATEPQLFAHNFFIDETESKMTVVAIHPDSHRWSFTWRSEGPRSASSVG